MIGVAGVNPLRGVTVTIGPEGWPKTHVIQDWIAGLPVAGEALYAELEFWYRYFGGNR